MSLFHTIKPSDIWPGDHLYIWSSPLHQHHGIVIFVAAKNPADSKVLEFNTHDGSRTKSHARIQVVTLEQFRRNRVLKRAVYGSQWARWKKAGTAYLTESLAPENVVDNAQLILEQIKFGGDLLVPNDPETLWSDADGHGYSLILRNCECLAYWCKTGRWYSEQVMQMVENVSKYILALIKGFFDYLVRAKFIPPIGQEAFRCVMLLYKKMDTVTVDIFSF